MWIRQNHWQFTQVVKMETLEQNGMAVASELFPVRLGPVGAEGRTLGVLTQLASTSANTRPHYLCGCYGKDVNCIPLPAKLKAVFFFFFLFFPHNGSAEAPKSSVPKSGGVEGEI